MSKETVAANYQEWLKVETEIQQWISRRWFNPTAAQDVFQGGLEIFLRRNSGQRHPGQVMQFAKACCRYAARQQGYWSRQITISGELVDVQEVEIEGADLVTDDQETALDLLLRIEEKVNIRQYLRYLDPRMQRVVQGVLQGLTFSSAAKIEGLTAVQVSSAFADLGVKLTGRRRQTRAISRIAVIEQLPLFQVVGE